MKQLLLILFSIFLASASAQKGEEDINRHSFGFGFGINGCMPLYDNTKPDIGYSGELNYNYYFSEKLHLHTGLYFSNYVYSRKSLFNTSEYEIVNYPYIDIPVEFSYEIKRFSFNAGLSKSLLKTMGLGANFNIGYSFNQTKTHKKIELILPSLKYITDLSDIDASTYLILETKLLFSF